MRRVRERQERLARLHFDLYADDDHRLLTFDNDDDVTDAKFAELRGGLKDLQSSMCVDEILS